MIEELKKLHDMIDEYYSNTEPHSPMESDLYLQIDLQYNRIVELWQKTRRVFTYED